MIEKNEEIGNTLNILVIIEKTNRIENWSLDY